MQPEEETGKPATVPTYMQGACFTHEEWTRLWALHQRIASLPDYRELGTDIRRLEFVRWLVQHGKLSEG